ncbi:sensor histidine kinase [Pedobacter sp. GR22-10]|uniref:sensor histidine kinase n=1 Tax=Pedobacter sp. GR22-10 TaxID=2994472 RepID=UPI0022484D4F|nr:sensor histidine kinase [Pedobacter sp. GR22-10]MCX2429904.1 histidine kinase [Pedobacter sp. GR22-10]
MLISSEDIAKGLWRSFFIWSISTGYWFARYSIEKVKELADSKEREIRLENDFIRSQVNPHFLLNTLTFIYYKLVPTNPDIAKTVAMLSEMMQYSVRNNAENAKVSLADDLAQINRYLEIQQTLNGHQLYLTFKAVFAADEKSIFLPPLIFLNFVENVFKYGQLKDQDHPAFISIDYDGRILHFHSENFVSPSNQVRSNFIGIANTKARLDKHFDQNYLLQTGLHNGVYEVDLKISL